MAMRVLACLMALYATSRAQPRLKRVDLEMIAPTPRTSDAPTTGMVRMRTAPSDGIRERDGEVAVTAVCGERYCVDGLVDLHASQVLIDTKLRTDDQQILTVRGGTVQRVVKLAHVDARYISIYTGDSTYSGGVHHNQSLACTTFDRATHAAIRLRDVVSPARARDLLASARMQIASHPDSDNYSLSESSFRLTDTELVLCAPGRPPSDGTILEISGVRSDHL